MLQYLRTQQVGLGGYFSIHGDTPCFYICFICWLVSYRDSCRVMALTAYLHSKSGSPATITGFSDGPQFFHPCSGSEQEALPQHREGVHWQRSTHQQSCCWWCGSQWCSRWRSWGREWWGPQREATAASVQRCSVDSPHVSAGVGWRATWTPQFKSQDGVRKHCCR